MDTSEGRSSKLWMVGKVLVALGCFYIGLKLLESFFVYSLALEGIRALPAHPDRYETARAGRILTMSAFIFSQLAGGIVLHSISRRGAVTWGGRTRGALLFSGAFGLCTLIAVMAIIWRH